MLSHLVTSTSDDETRGGRDIESILAVATRTDHVDVAVTIEDGRNACRQDTITETEQFIHRHTTHLQSGEQGCDLFLRELTLGDTHDDVLGFLTRKFLVVQHSVQDVLHFHNSSLLFLFFIFFLKMPSATGQIKKKDLS